jgi:hypothetical protein
MLFKEIISVYSENHTKLMHTLFGQNEEEWNVKVGGKCKFHYDLELILSINVLVSQMACLRDVFQPIFLPPFANNFV